MDRQPRTSLLDVYMSTINNINRDRTEHIFGILKTWLYSFPREYRFIFMASFDSPVYTDPQTFFCHSTQNIPEFSQSRREMNKTKYNIPTLVILSITFQMSNFLTQKSKSPPSQSRLYSSQMLSIWTIVYILSLQNP